MKRAELFSIVSERSGKDIKERYRYGKVFDDFGYGNNCDKRRIKFLGLKDSPEKYSDLLGKILEGKDNWIIVEIVGNKGIPGSYYPSKGDLCIYLEKIE